MAFIALQLQHQCQGDQAAAIRFEFRIVFYGIDLGRSKRRQRKGQHPRQQYGKNRRSFHGLTAPFYPIIPVFCHLGVPILPWYPIIFNITHYFFTNFDKNMLSSFFLQR
jgi:hypothetical protein